jgi:hypothetical protein
MAMAGRTTELEDRLEFEIDPALQKELLRHPGKWVTMTRHEVIAIGDTPQEVLTKARAEGHRSPILYQVPTPGEDVYFF